MLNFFISILQIVYSLLQGLRLADGPYSSWGRPEYYFNSQWETFNTQAMSSTETEVICNQLGYSGKCSVYTLLRIMMQYFSNMFNFLP